MTLEIRIADLRLITDRIFDHIEKDLHVSAVEIKQDYYWDLQDDNLYDPANEPTELGLGQLYEDWQFLSAILVDKEQAVALMLLHLAPILRYVGSEIGQ